MSREIDESWIEEAIDRYRRTDQLREEYEKAVATHFVSVHSPDDSIEIVVSATGEITDVQLYGTPQQRRPADLAREIQAVVTSAAEAARWAREKLHDEIFGKLRSLGDS